MKLLLAWPPHIPSYFNLCYHFVELGEIAAYLRKNDIEVKILDGGVLSLSWDDFFRELQKGYDVLAILNRTENVDSVRRLANYCKEISPSTKILTYGQASVLIPNFFKNYHLDAIVYSGDWELVIKKYVDYLEGKCLFKDLNGLLIKTNNKWVKTNKGGRLSPEEWEFPALDLLPLDDYNRIYEKEENISGIKGKKELSFTVSRGCPYNCIFCTAPKIDGLVERRRSVSAVLGFIRDSIKYYNFDYISMFSPTFTLNKKWVLDFCSKIVKEKLNIKWKCVTTINNIDSELVHAMAEAGCFRIGFGVETLELEAQKNIHKFVSEEQLKKVISLCLENNITPLCFLMIGIPGQTKEGIEYTINKIQEMGGEIRATIYTPYQELNENMSEEEVLTFDRGIHKKLVKGMTEREIFNIILK